LHTLEDARAEGDGYFWLLDDDLTGFKTGNNGATARGALSFAEGILNDYEGVALVGLDFQQFAWRQEKPFSANSRCYACVLVRTDTGISYEAQWVMKSDVDYTIRTLEAGWNSVLVHKYAMITQTMGSATVGGSGQYYVDGLDSVYAERIVERFPDYARLIDKGDRLDARVSWRMFGQPLRSKAAARLVAESADSPQSDSPIAEDSMATVAGD
jgi:hypothetical protein